MYTRFPVGSEVQCNYQIARGKLVKCKVPLLLCPHGAPREKTEMLHSICRQSGLEEKIHKIHICTVQGWLFFEKIQ